MSCRGWMLLTRYLNELMRMVVVTRCIKELMKVDDANQVH